MDIATKSLIESCQDLCFHKRIDKCNRSILDIDVSDWIQVLINHHQEILSKYLNDFKYFNLIFKNVNSLENNVCNLIAQLLGSRIIEITFEKCSGLKWNCEIKKIIANSKCIESLKLIDNSWVDDYVMEQLSVRYKKSVMHLEIENSSISDSALFQFGRRCTSIHTLTLVCCPKVTDVGLSEIAKNNHISILKLSHNFKISDKGVENLLSNACNLQSVVLVNNPQLTDQALAALYEANAPWGKKRNVESQPITRLDIKFSPNFTTQSLVWISACLPNVNVLDMRECIGIDLVKGMSEIINMRKITDLKIGPSNPSKVFNAQRFLQAMMYQAPQLLSLHLIGLTGFTDDNIGELIENSPNLNNIILQDLEFASLTIESICSNIPNITSLQLIGSRIFADIDLRCLTTICRNLVELTIQRCPKLSDAGFTRFVSLKQLKLLNLNHCAPVGQCTGGILKFLSVSPLTSLYLDGLHLNVKEFFPCLMNPTKTKLMTLSIRLCPGVFMDDVVYLLETYVGCRILDCTDCPNLPPHANRLHTLHSNPFLTYDYKPDFCGYILTDHLRSVYLQFWSQQKQLRKHYGARLMQNLRRRYLKRLLDLKQERRDRWSDFKIHQLTIIQAYIRFYLVRKRFKRKLNAGRRIVRAGRDFLFYKDYLKSKKSIHYYRSRLVKVCFMKFKINMDSSLAHLKPIRNELKIRKQLRDLKINFKILQLMYLEYKENAFEDSASAFYEVNFLTKIIKCWKKVIFETSSRKQQLVHMFLQCATLTTYNSSRQLNNKRISESFYKQRLSMIAWMVLAKDLMETRRANSLIPLAINHANKYFFRHVVGGCFNGFNIHKENRKFKRVAKLRAIIQYDKYSKFCGCKFILHRIEYIQIAKALMKIAFHVHLKFLMKKGIFERFPIHTFHTKHFKILKDRSIKYFNNRIFTVGFEDFKFNIVKSKEFRVMWRKAEMKSDNNYINRTYRSWVIFAKNNKNMGDFYYRRYMQKIQRQIIHSLLLNRALGKDYVQTVKLECEKKLKSPDGFYKIVKFIRRFQAIVRARKVRSGYQEDKIQKLYAIQVLQNFFRTFLARKEYTSRFRKQLISEVVSEGNELELMRQEDVEMHYYNYQIKAVINFQRIFRGWKGRVIAADRAVIYYRDISKDYYTNNKLMRFRYEAFKRANIAKEHQRILMCINIQKVGRGYIARKYVKKLRHIAKMAKYAVYVQRDYRRRLAQLKLQGMKRDKNNELRFQAARKQRGTVLRLFGFKNRKQQAAAAVILNELGLDPLSFNYRIKELINDTIKDCKVLWNIFQREKLLFNQNSFNQLAITLGRRKILINQGLKINVQDAVKIIEEGHKYAGYTGRVTRIDETLFGLPLYEVKLDRIPKLTFTRMTGDALLIYSNSQPLTKIDRIQELEEFIPREPIFGVDPEDLFYCKKNVNAAWTIERAFRMHRARKVADRKRYELWLRSTARQWSLYNHMAETNTITTQAHNISWLLKIKPRQTIFFDEVRHFIIPDRFSATATKMAEKKSIQREYLLKFRDRITYLQKCAIIAGKDYFATGYERMTFNRKLLLLLRGSFGVLSKGSSSIRGIFGSKGAKLLSKQIPLVTGLDKYCFDQFIGSPHVRYPKVSLFQGEWSGIPFVTTLKPHGPGLAVFLDAWGYAKEDKVLYLTIVKCRYLNAADFDTSDPYCVIQCNGTLLQTTVKWRNLNPDYYESFEIDVTNPSATLNITVYDSDYLGSDDFLGQLELKLSDYEDGKEVEQTHLLKGEDLSIVEEEDRGEITVRLRWAERKFEDDQARDALKLMKAIRLQAWARRISALKKTKKIRRERFELLQMVKMKAIMITNTCRIRLARKEMKRRMRLHKSAIKIQKRIRIWIAKKKFARKLLRRDAAIVIQTRMRICLAKAFVARMIAKENADVAATVTIIQKNARRMIVRCAVARRNAEKAIKLQKLRELAAEEGEVYVEEVPPAVSTWIDTYGVDPEYRLKRNRRITERLFQRILRTKYVRMRTKYGIVYVESYPPKKTEEEMLTELEEGAKESLTNRKDFVAVYFPTFAPTSLHRKQVIERCNKIAHIAYLHIPTSVVMRQTVDYNISTIQCLQRQRLARRARDKMIRVHKAIALFQRIFRMRYEIFHKSSVLISSLFRAIKAKKVTAILRKERNAAWKIQSGFRCYVARSKRFDLYCVSDLSVLKYSPSYLEFHGPEKALEHREDTFWVSETIEKAEIRVEFSKAETITEVWIMTSTYSASPNFVSIYVVPNKKRNYIELVDRTELPLLKQYRWHKFPVSLTVAKYFKIVFHDNYGDDKYISVRQIRFLKSKEKSATIVKQPLQYIMERGPSVGDTGNLVLKCVAEGWPTPTYQWYKGTTPIPGEIEPELRLQLQCPTVGIRSYRCLKCKMVSTQVPFNAYHIQCGNCSKLFAYKDIEDYDLAIERVKAKDQSIIDQINALITSRIQLEGFKNEKYIPMIADLNDRIKKFEDEIQVLRESRIEIKQKVPNCNLFTDEGVYYCIVQNFRGGTMKMVTKSIGAVVVVEHSIPYVVEVGPVYVPRVQTIRKKWNIYASIQGTFTKGRLEGLVVIRYNDGSFYEGPYVPETGLDYLGKTLPDARAKNHYGIFKLRDGRIFEGLNVDNHFDQRNLNSFYRLTLPNNKGVYEGYFCDEMYHGTGMFTYEDGSVYEGHWFRGTRFGHGHFRSAEGWTYEGFFDTDRKHRHGVINWPNGACYMGEWYYDDIKGKGIFITPLRDVYRGELQNKLFNGRGELIYADASMYVGDFKDGLRHGRGIFTDRLGHEYYGNFVSDVMHGEHVVKLIIETEEIGQNNYEIRVGQYDNGVLVQWKSKFSNPVATKQFIKLFKKNREMFDSVYSMILAKNLPALPDGIDANNEQIKTIVYKIRQDAGMLVGEHALNQAMAQLNALLKPVSDKKELIDSINRELENLSVDKIAYEKEAHKIFLKFTTLMSRYEKDFQKIEQFWMDEPTEVRPRFNLACKSLDTLTVDDYFSFRNHRVVPPFVKKILDAISCLLDLEFEWKTQQFIIADAIANGRNGDEEALRLNYKCKLSHMMKTSYKVYDYVFFKNTELMNTILADTRFHRDSYYVQSTGPCGPILVDWIKTNYQYTKAAKTVYDQLHKAEELKTSAFRAKAIHVKKQEEIVEIENKISSKKAQLQIEQLELGDLQHGLLKANDLLEFISGRYKFGQSDSKQDYYKLFEQKLEAKRDLFTVEVCLQGIMNGVLNIAEREKQQKIRETLANGEKWIEPVITKPLIKDWILEEVLAQQTNVQNKDKTLGYWFEPEPSDISKEYTEQLISLIIDIVTAKLNDTLNDRAEARSWLTMKGKIVSSRFLYIEAWRCWEQKALGIRDMRAIATWEEIFGDSDACARMAIEARLSVRMSAIAREQGKVWAKYHPEEIRIAEINMSFEFEQQYESIQETAQQALIVIDDESGDISPTMKACCASWMRLHPEEMNVANDAKNIYLAELFKEQFPESTGEVCFKILNGWGNSEEMEWIEYADHWKSFNMEEYTKSSEALLKEMAADFSDKYPSDTYMEAAQIIEKNAVAQFILDDEVKATYTVDPKDLLNANTWGTLHQGMLRKAKAILYKEFQGEVNKQWNELMLLTENFQKGSALYAIDNVEDRFLGFRNRLMNKFAWMHGYICLQQDLTLKAITSHALIDPFEKVLHRVRPSQLEQYKKEKDEEYLREQKRLENLSEALVAKLSTWNTYFGQHKQILEDQY